MCSHHNYCLCCESDFKVERDHFRIIRHFILHYSLQFSHILKGDFQIENEYGSFGSDHEYLRTLYNIFRNVGQIVMPIFCSNGYHNHLSFV
jgi:hypothetical protein